MWLALVFSLLLGCLGLIPGRFTAAPAFFLVAVALFLVLWVVRGHREPRSPSLVTEMLRALWLGALPGLFAMGLAVWAVGSGRPWSSVFEPVRALLAVPLPLAVGGATVVGCYLATLALRLRRPSREEEARQLLDENLDSQG